jgi:hypothetical protein
MHCHHIAACGLLGRDMGSESCSYKLASPLWRRNPNTIWFGRLRQSGRLEGIAG